MHRISVITPSYKQLGWLKLCAASVADQAGVEVEHIVQDAGTGAGTAACPSPEVSAKLFGKKVQLPARSMVSLG